MLTALIKMKDLKIIFNRTSSNTIRKKGPDELLFEIILESFIHINAINRMGINLLSKCD